MQEERSSKRPRLQRPQSDEKPSSSLRAASLSSTAKKAPKAMTDEEKRKNMQDVVRKFKEAQAKRAREEDQDAWPKSSSTSSSEAKPMESANPVTSSSEIRWKKELFDAWVENENVSEVEDTPFLVAKTPLSTIYETQIGGEKNEFTIDSFVDGLNKKEIFVPLVVDSVSDQKSYLYDRNEIYEEWDMQRMAIPLEKSQIGPGLTEEMYRFVPPSRPQVAEFIKRVKESRIMDPEGRIVVISTLGCNRAGVLVISYMVEELKIELPEALKRFAKSRPPGVYSKLCLEALQRRYGAKSSLDAPAAPSWDAMAVNLKTASSENFVMKALIPDAPFPMPAPKSKVPHPWEVKFSKSNKRNYYFNPKTGKSVWNLADCK